MADLVAFIGGEFSENTEYWTVSKKYFQGITILLLIHEFKRTLDINYEGENIEKINNYARG